MRPNCRCSLHSLVLLSGLVAGGNVSSDDQIRPAAVLIEEETLHLRSGETREWAEFPERADAARLDVSFESSANSAEQTLRLWQHDVKQVWQVKVNGKRIGQLSRDENETVTYLALPPGTLVDGSNRLVIETAPDPSDDIRLGEIVLERQPREAVLNSAVVQVTVVEAGTGQPLPARITVLSDGGAQQTVGAESSRELAVRPGTVYTSTGTARFGLPVGSFTIYAGRGFEYSLDRRRVQLAAGDSVELNMEIRREVPTDGYVACDTHVHTLTHSGHGDATVQERMVTLAAEGIELPIATDHNVHVDHDSFAREAGVRPFFTPVVGNEVTTRVGHFNIFPVAPAALTPDHRLESWDLILDDVFRTPGVKVAILNHARDLHSGNRPFGPKSYNSVVAETLNGWPIRFNAMEVINSGATQTDHLQLCHDWMNLLNRGYRITPVGSSDSHDVARFFVGQGRTYIRCDDRDPGDIPVDDAVNSFLQGRVNVSYGLLAELTVDGRYGPGEFVPVPDEQLRVDVTVLGPHWVTASRVMLFANGLLIREAEIEKNRQLEPGVKWRQSWQIRRPSHDVHLVAVALGEGTGLYWKTAKPYQPTSPVWTPHTLGCSGAVWIDADRDGLRSCARDYAVQAFAGASGELNELLGRLSRYDAAVAAHAAHLYQLSGGSIESESVASAVRNSTEPVREGFERYFQAWRENQRAQF